MSDNMISALDIRKRIPARLEAIGCSASFFAQFVGVGAVMFSLQMSGGKPLSNDEGKRLEKQLVELENLVKAARPLPLSFTPKTISIIKELARKVEQKHLRITIQDDSWSAQQHPLPGVLVIPPAPVAIKPAENNLSGLSGIAPKDPDFSEELLAKVDAAIHPAKK